MSATEPWVPSRLNTCCVGRPRSVLAAVFAADRLNIDGIAGFDALSKLGANVTSAELSISAGLDTCRVCGTCSGITGVFAGYGSWSFAIRSLWSLGPFWLLGAFRLITVFLGSLAAIQARCIGSARILAATALSTTICQTLALCSASYDCTAFFTGYFVFIFVFWDAVLLYAFLNRSTRHLPTTIVAPTTLNACIEDPVTHCAAAVSTAWGVGTDRLLSIFICHRWLWPFGAFGSLRTCSLIGTLSSLAMFTGISIELKPPSTFLPGDVKVTASLESLGQSIYAMLSKCLLDLGDRKRLNVAERVWCRSGLVTTAHEADG